MRTQQFANPINNITAIFAAMLALVVAPSAAAQDAVQLQMQRHGVVGQANPSLTVRVQAPLRQLTVQLACGATKANHQAAASSGSTVKIELKVPAGAHRCSGNLGIVTETGDEGSMPLSFEVEQHPAVRITVQREDVDTHAKSLAVRTDRQVQAIEVDVYGLNGLIGGGRATAGAPGSPIPVQWRDNGEETLRLDVKAIDMHGFTSALQLFPWHYDVPHEDVIFESGAATIRPTEEPKLHKALAEIMAVMQKYGAIAKVNLYVAGFTDSVGDPSRNQKLSEQRARAIAAWFAAQGFSPAIFVRGLGEHGQLVPTPDETDEAKNRRATYILAAEAPPPSATLPAGTWTPLR